MKDIFDHTILCENCNLKMKRVDIDKNGFILRSVTCENCGDRIIHPHDQQEYEQFNTLRNKDYRVKLRLVGNSYAVSIPREIVNFIQLQEKIMDDMVRLCFEDARKLTLQFSEENEDGEENKKYKSKNKTREEFIK